MSTDFKLTPHADYVHVELAPDYEIKPDGTTQLTHAISDVCARQGQRRVLIEGTIARRSMGTMDSFGFGSLVGSMLAGMSLACCLYGYAPTSRPSFSGTWRRTAACASSSSPTATPRCAGLE